MNVRKAVKENESAYNTFVFEDVPFWIELLLS